VYVSLLLYPLAEIDMDTLQVRWSPERFGGGQLAGHKDRVYQTDLLFDRVHVIDLEDLSVRQTLELDFTPRAVAVDPSRDLLLVGDWLAGDVHLYRLSTLEPIDPVIPVGPYVRDLALDPERGLLFAASKCGVYKVYLDKILEAAGP
jgi:hypothetical protein